MGNYWTIKDFPPEVQAQVQAQLDQEKKGNVQSTSTVKVSQAKTTDVLVPSMEEKIRSREKGVRTWPSIRRPDRALYLYPVIGCIGLLGSAFLALGWMMMEVGQGIWRLGERLHEDKWRIGEA